MNKIVFIWMRLCMLTLLWCVSYSPVFPSQQPDWVKEVYDQVHIEINRYAKPGGVVGYSIKDLTSGEQFDINGDLTFPAASVIKIPVMVYAFHLAEIGKLSFREHLVLYRWHKLPGSGSLQYARSGSVYTIGRLIDVMIQDSDNTATHMLITRLGISNINSYMQTLGLRNTMIKELTLIEKTPGFCNYTTPKDMQQLMEKMYNKTLVSKRASEEMLGIMKGQLHRWGIPRFLPSTVIIANKTGSLDYVRNDVGIVFDRNKPYIISIFAKHLPSNPMGSVLVGSISKTVYDIKCRE